MGEGHINNNKNNNTPASLQRERHTDNTTIQTIIHTDTQAPGKQQQQRPREEQQKQRQQ